MNRRLWPKLETIFLIPSDQYSFISSSLIKEVAQQGGQVSDFLSPKTYKALMLKFFPRKNKSLIKKLFDKNQI